MLTADEVHKIVLASQSAGRRGVLESAGVQFEVQTSDFDERSVTADSTAELVQELSREKARVVAPQHEKALVIGADNLVVIDGQELGKPADEEEAATMLRTLSGRWHEILNGMTVINTEISQEATGITITKVLFRELSDHEVAEYAASGEPMSKAGAYGIQDRGGFLVERVEGDYNAIIGMSLVLLSELAGQVGVRITDFIQ